MLINIKISLLSILPKSPCEHSLAIIEKDGVPTEDKVDAIFEAINPLLPTPMIITLDLHFEIIFIAFLKSSLIEYFNFFKALI